MFSAGMARNRFRTILQYLRFDDRSARREKKDRGEFVPKDQPVQPFLNLFSANLRRLYVLSLYLTVDEMVVSFRGRCPFRIYMKSKPERYGIKIWAVVDVRSSYVLGLQIYVGMFHVYHLYQFLDYLPNGSSIYTLLPQEEKLTRHPREIRGKG